MAEAVVKPLTIAVLAVGGQGGGVLSNWLVTLAEANGWRAQNTSVPGVAQRTGATVYYIEMLPETEREPVLALMPAPGEVDVCVAAELMEAGRAIQRGLVSPDRTLLIASSHRAYSLSEKAAPGDGRADAGAVLAAGESAAQRFVHADMAAIAETTGSVISAALFGAIAGAGALPFPRAAFEATIERGGVGVAPSLAAFAAGFDAVTGRPEAAKPPESPPRRLQGGSEEERRRYAAACERLRSRFPAPAHAMLQAGLDAVVDFQDAAYGDEYLDRVGTLAAADPGTNDCELTTTAAKYVSRAMAYDDVIRVAELKTRGTRSARVREDVGAAVNQPLRVTEFMHPRLEEMCATLPARLGQAIEGSQWLARPLRRVIDRGRRVRTDSLSGFVLMNALAGLRRWRRGSLRHRRELQRMESWLDLVIARAEHDREAAVEILKCQRLIKGYSGTHTRGTGKYAKVLSALSRLDGRADTAVLIRELREAALRDEAGDALDAVLATLDRAPPPDGSATGLGLGVESIGPRRRVSNMRGPYTT